MLSSLSTTACLFSETAVSCRAVSCGVDLSIDQAISGPKNEDKSQGEVGGALKGMGYTSDMVYKF